MSSTTSFSPNTYKHQYHPNDLAGSPSPVGPQKRILPPKPLFTSFEQPEAQTPAGERPASPELHKIFTEAVKHQQLTFKTVKHNFNAIIGAYSAGGGDLTSITITPVNSTNVSLEVVNRYLEEAYACLVQPDISTPASTEIGKAVKCAQVILDLIETTQQTSILHLPLPRPLYLPTRISAKSS